MQQIDKLSFRAFSFLFLFAMFFPVFHNQFGSSGAILVNGGLILGIIGYFLIFQKFKFFFSCPYQKKIFLIFSFLFIFFFFHITISMIIGNIIGGIEIIKRDMYEFHRPVLYLLTFSLAFLVFSQIGAIALFEKALLIVFLLIVLLGINHYFGIYDALTELYTKELNIRTRRVSAPFGNPYDYAFMMSFFILYFFLKMIFTAKFYLIYFLIAVVMFILPQSRSVAVGFMVGFFVILPIIFLMIGFNFKNFVITKKLVSFISSLFLFTLTFVCYIPYLIENYGYLTGQFIRLIEGDGIGSSATARVDQLLFAFEKSSENVLIFIFGNGPAKSEMEYVESIYTYQFYRYGLLGFFLNFLVIKVLLIYFSWKILKNTVRDDLNYPLIFTILIWLLTVPLMSIGNNFTEQIRLSFFFYSIAGLVAAIYSLRYRKY